MRHSHTSGSGHGIEQFITLIVGDLAQWRAGGRTLPQVDGMIFVDIDDIELDFLNNISPDIVVSPLVARKFDAVEVARRLAAANYNGPYRVVAEPVPDSALIRAEIASVAPQVDFELVHISDLELVP